MTTLPEEPTAKVKVTSQESQGSKLFKIMYFDLQPTFRITFYYRGLVIRPYFWLFIRPFFFSKFPSGCP